MRAHLFVCLLFFAGAAQAQQTQPNYFGSTWEARQIEQLRKERVWLLKRNEQLGLENARLWRLYRWKQDPTLRDPHSFPRLKNLREQLEVERRRSTEARP